MTRTVGLLGGTFDPPHVGHLVVADEARVALGLDEVRLVVAGRPWMKDGVGPTHHRVTMAQLATATDPHLVVDEREARRDGPTYTADTLEELRAAHDDVQWVFLLGADAAVHLDRWHRVETALSLARFVVVTRPDSPVPPRSVAGHVLEHLAVPPMGVSSTAIRDRVRTGGAWRHLVPPQVAAHVVDHHLYEDS